MIRVYGIRQCDTCRKALKWLQQRDLAFEFTDLRDHPVSAGRLRRWVTALGEDRLINRRSTTWRQLEEQQRAQADGPAAVQLLAEHPTLIKRPLLEWGNELTVGYQPQVWEKL